MCVGERISLRVRQAGWRVCPAAHLVPCHLPQAGWCGTVAQMLVRLFPVAFWQGGVGVGVGGPFRKTKAHSLWQKNPKIHTSWNKTSPLSRMRQHCDNKHIYMILLLFFIFFLNRSLSYTYSTTCSWQIFMAHPYFSYILQSLVCLWGYGKWTSEPVGRWWADLWVKYEVATAKHVHCQLYSTKGGGGACTHTDKPPLSVCGFFQI